jgi:hypothetical protein
MVPANELAAIQAEVAKAFDLTATVQRQTLGVPDAFGTEAGNFTNVTGLVNIGANLTQPHGGQLQEMGKALVDQAAWIVSFPVFDTNGSPVVIVRGDQISIAGITLVVNRSLNPNSYSIVTQVLASQVR